MNEMLLMLCLKYYQIGKNFENFEFIMSFEGGLNIPGVLFDMVHSKILSLDSDYLIYPAHDYTGRSVSSVDEEKRLNPRMTKTKEEFVQFMTEMKLDYPKKIDLALPWNKVNKLFVIVLEKILRIACFIDFFLIYLLLFRSLQNKFKPLCTLAIASVLQQV